MQTYLFKHQSPPTILKSETMKVTLTGILPLGTVMNPPRVSSSSLVETEICILNGSEVDSILLAVFTVSPNKQNL